MIFVITFHKKKISIMTEEDKKIVKTFHLIVIVKLATKRMNRRRTFLVNSNI